MRIYHNKTYDSGLKIRTPFFHRERKEATMTSNDWPEEKRLAGCARIAEAQGWHLEDVYYRNGRHTRTWVDNAGQDKHTVRAYRPDRSLDQAFAAARALGLKCHVATKGEGHEACIRKGEIRLWREAPDPALALFAALLEVLR